MAIDLEALTTEVSTSGWATAIGTIDDVQAAARRLRWTPVPARLGDPDVSELRPTASEDAKVNSLSARYGLGPLPLHTDAAHHRRPPDLVVLSSETESSTSTLLWSWRGLGLSAQVWDAMNHGVFLVRPGGDSDSFHASAYVGHRLRFDPGCMTPCDRRARDVTAFFEEALPSASAHKWKAGEILVFDNRVALHARSAVAEGDAGRMLKRVAYYVEDVQ